MTLYIIVLIVAAILLAALIYVKSRKYSIKVVYIKAAVSVCFMLTAFIGTYRQFSGSGFMATPYFAASFPFFVMPGLLLGLLGDIWLDLKYAHREETTAHTYAGFISFLTGHLFYIVGLIINFNEPGKALYIILPIVIGMIIGVIIGITGKMMKLDYGRYKIIVMIYGGILVSMTLLSGSLALMNGWRMPVLNQMFAGGVLFLISDLVLSQMYFGQGHEYKGGFIAVNLITYYAAQFMIASAIMWM